MAAACGPCPSFVWTSAIYPFLPATMPKCCSCSSSGVCKACSCARGRRLCRDCAPSRYSRCANIALPGCREPQRESSRPATAHRVAASSASSSSSSPFLSSFPMSSSSSLSSFNRLSTRQSAAGACPAVTSRSMKPAGTIARASRALEPKNAGRQLTPSVSVRTF